jgi:hypothetical protein
MVIQNRQRILAFVLGNLFVATLNEVVNKMVVGGLEQGDVRDRKIFQHLLYCYWEKVYHCVPLHWIAVACRSFLIHKFTD